MQRNQKNVLNLVNLHALINPNPRSIGTKFAEDHAKRTSLSDSQSLPLSYSQGSQSSGTQNLDEKFSFPKLNADSDENSPYGRPPSYGYRNSNELLHLSELQQSRKTMQEHEDTISKISMNLSVFQEDVKALCTEVKSLKSEIKTRSALNDQRIDCLISEVKQEKYDNGKITVDSLKDELSGQTQLLERTCQKVDTLQGNVNELIVLYKNGIANMETLLKKRLLELSTDQIKRFDDMEHAIFQMQERKFNELRKDMETTQGEGEPQKVETHKEDVASSGNSFDDVFNIDDVSQFIESKPKTSVDQPAVPRRGQRKRRRAGL